jgi:hypothetical protein
MQFIKCISILNQLDVLKRMVVATDDVIATSSHELQLVHYAINTVGSM